MTTTMLLCLAGSKNIEGSTYSEDQRLQTADNDDFTTTTTQEAFIRPTSYRSTSSLYAAGTSLLHAHGCHDTAKSGTSFVQLHRVRISALKEVVTRRRIL